MKDETSTGRPEETGTDVRREPSPPGRPTGVNEPREARFPVRRVDSADLFAGSPCVVILHAGAEYRLQITRMGKLILTK